MHPDEVRKREREALPPLKPDKAIKRAKQEIQTEQNNTHKTNTISTIEGIRFNQLVSIWHSIKWLNHV